MANLANEDGRIGAFVTPLSREEGVADALDQQTLDRLAGPAVQKIAGRILACAHGTQDLPMDVDDPLRDAQDSVLLNVKDRLDALNQRIRIDGRLGNENDVGLTVSGP